MKLKLKNVQAIEMEVRWLRDGGVVAGSGACVSWLDREENRYHVWVTNRPSAGEFRLRGGWAIENGRIYKNPPTGTNSGTTGYFRTRYLDAEKNAEVLSEIWDHVDPKAAVTAYEEKQAAETAKREDEAKAIWLEVSPSVGEAVLRIDVRNFDLSDSKNEIAEKIEHAVNTIRARIAAR